MESQQGGDNQFLLLIEKTLRNCIGSAVANLVNYTSFLENKSKLFFYCW